MTRGNEAAPPDQAFYRSGRENKRKDAISLQRRDTKVQVRYHSSEGLCP